MIPLTSIQFREPHEAWNICQFYMYNYIFLPSVQPQKVYSRVVVDIPFSDSIIDSISFDSYNFTAQRMKYLSILHYHTIFLPSVQPQEVNPRAVIDIHFYFESIIDIISFDSKKPFVVRQ